MFNKLGTKTISQFNQQLTQCNEFELTHWFEENVQTTYKMKITFSGERKNKNMSSRKNDLVFCIFPQYLSCNEALYDLKGCVLTK